MDNAAEKRIERWRTVMRPMMKWLLLSLAAFFFLATLFQLIYLNAKISVSPKMSPSEILALSRCAPDLKSMVCEEHRKLSIAATLESILITTRNHQDGVFLMSAIWTRYLGFVTGMVLALVGAGFVLGRLSDNGTSLDVASQQNLARFMFVTSSPGLVLALFGVALMLATIMAQQRFETNYAPVYFTPAPSSLRSLGYPEPKLPVVEAQSMDIVDPVPPMNEGATK